VPPSHVRMPLAFRVKVMVLGLQRREPGQLVVEFGTGDRIAVRKIEAADDHPVHRRFDIARLAPVGLARQRPASGERGGAHLLPNAGGLGDDRRALFLVTKLVRGFPAQPSPTLRGQAARPRLRSCRLARQARAPRQHRIARRGRNLDGIGARRRDPLLGPDVVVAQHARIGGHRDGLAFAWL